MFFLFIFAHVKLFIALIVVWRSYGGELSAGMERT